MTRLSEDDLIARYFAPLAGVGGLGLRDDAAVLNPRAGRDLVLTVDMLAAGIHFFPDDPPASIARKALGVNVSDLAAKGADPVGFLLGLALPDGWTESWLAAFAQGLGEAAGDWRCPLLGGDTVRANGGLTLSITALGEVPRGRMVQRGAARAGDVLCITGTIGDAALGLRLRAEGEGQALPSGDSAGTRAVADAGRWGAALSEADRRHLVDRFLHPQPRIALGAALRDNARAAMDVSDGLAGDLAKMMRTSGAAAVVEGERVPLSLAARAALRADAGLIDLVLTGGDDYEILCAVPPERVEPLTREAGRAGVALAAIGQVVAGEGLPVFRIGGAKRRFPAGSFSHF
jgi:thiamine-monophosphate kinase